MVQNFLKKCYDNRYFESENVEQFYCNKCEQYLADRFVEGINGFCGFIVARGDICGKCLNTLELKSPKCTICNETPIFKTPNHLFLRLDL